MKVTQYTVLPAAGDWDEARIARTINQAVEAALGTSLMADTPEAAMQGEIAYGTLPENIGGVVRVTFERLNEGEVA